MKVNPQYSDNERLSDLKCALEKKDKLEAQSTLDEILRGRQSDSAFVSPGNIDKHMRIYVAGPYTPYGVSFHDAARVANENTVRAINVGVDVALKGHFPFIPHLSHYMHLHGKATLSYEYYIGADMTWLDVSDAILFYNHTIGASSGADKELEVSIGSGKKIFFFIEEIPSYSKK